MPQTAARAEPLPAEIGDAFRNGCFQTTQIVGVSVAADYCACAGRALVAEISQEEFQELARAADAAQRDGMSPAVALFRQPKMAALARRCAESLGVESLPVPGAALELDRRSCLAAASHVASDKRTQYCTCVVDEIRARMTLQSYLLAAIGITSGRSEGLDNSDLVRRMPTLTAIARHCNVQLGGG